MVLPGEHHDPAVLRSRCVEPPGAAHGVVGHAILVDVPYPRHAEPELVVGASGYHVQKPAIPAGVDIRPAGGSASGGIQKGPDDELRRPVPVQVTDARGHEAEKVAGCLRLHGIEDRHARLQELGVGRGNGPKACPRCH